MGITTWFLPIDEAKDNLYVAWVWVSCITSLMDGGWVSLQCLTNDKRVASSIWIIGPLIFGGTLSSPREKRAASEKKGTVSPYIVLIKQNTAIQRFGNWEF